MSPLDWVLLGGAVGEVMAGVTSAYLLWLTHEAGYLEMLRRASKTNRALRRKGASVDRALTLQNEETQTWEQMSKP